MAITLIHFGTLLIGMLCLVFVGADLLSRYLFLGVIGANLILTLGRFYELDVGMLLKTVGVLLLGNVSVKLYTKYKLNAFFKRHISKLKTKQPVENSSDSSSFNVSSTSSDKCIPSHRRENLNIATEQSTADRHRYHMLSHSHDHNHTNSTNFPVRRESVVRENSVSSRRSVHEYPQCAAFTLKGSQCTLTAYNPTGRCNMHNRVSRDRER